MVLLVLKVRLPPSCPPCLVHPLAPCGLKIVASYLLTCLFAFFTFLFFVLAADWNPVKREEAIDNAWLTYVAQKKFADQAVMQFAVEHPEIDITSCRFITHSPSYISTAPYLSNLLS
jgi:hypothetical protein